MLFSEQPQAQKLAGLLVGPIFFGIICGWQLGESELRYTVLTVIAMVGGIGAGFEHTSLREGALRGLFIGALFAFAICETHRAIDVSSLASTPKPIEILIPVFALISAALGTIGAAFRRRREQTLAA
jgi:hypothetical protein